MGQHIRESTVPLFHFQCAPLIQYEKCTPYLQKAFPTTSSVNPTLCAGNCYFIKCHQVKKITCQCNSTGKMPPRGNFFDPLICPPLNAIVTGMYNSNSCRIWFHFSELFPDLGGLLKFFYQKVNLEEADASWRKIIQQLNHVRILCWKKTGTFQTDFIRLKEEKQTHFQ